MTEHISLNNYDSHPHQLLLSMTISPACLIQSSLFSTPLHPVRVRTVQLASWPTDTPSNPCLCGLIRLAVCMCLHVCVKGLGRGDGGKHIILSHYHS